MPLAITALRSSFATLVSRSAISAAAAWSLSILRRPSLLTIGERVGLITGVTFLDLVGFFGLEDAEALGPGLLY